MFKKIIATVAFAQMMMTGLQAQTLNKSLSAAYEGENNLRYVDPLVGNVGALLQPTRPTVQVPNQMIRVYPLRSDYMSDQLQGFPLNIVSHRLGEVFLVKPSLTKAEDADSWKSMMTYDHDLEIDRPWYLSTYLVDDEIKVEFTPGSKTGFFRFTFPKGKNKSLLFSNFNRTSSSYSFLSDNAFAGMETYHGNIPVYLYGTFNAAGSVLTGDANNLSAAKETRGQSSRAAITFPASAPDGIEFRYAISYVSPEQAKKNYREEISGKGFDQVATTAKAAWSTAMDQIQVEGGTDQQRRSFYSALYRCYERMVNITEDSSYYSGYDNQVHTTSRPFYVDDWSWDTYLALHPLRMILNPKVEEDMIQSYITMYKQSGWLPTFPVLFGDHACMNGFHSTVFILDAYRKGLRNFDMQTAFEGVVKNATQATMLPWRNGPKEPLTDFYLSKGYFPSLPPGAKETEPRVDNFEKRQAVAVTLGHSYDDWAAGQLAKELGKDSLYNYFNKRGQNYRNVWQADKGFFMPRDDKGNWININPALDGGKGGREYYDENNGWTYLWQVQHDINGLVNLMGGNKAFESKLDMLFRKDIGLSKFAFWNEFPDATGLVGQYSMGNEPSFHIPYLYNYCGAAWKTQKRIRFLLDTWFKDNVFGIPGDEDGGGMTAFVVFSSMGFYPVTPGIPVYTIGSPVFSKVSIALPNGKQFTVIANNSSKENKYIQSAKLNGQVLNTCWFTHDDLVKGGTLELEMGPYPNKDWGNGAFTTTTTNTTWPAS